MNMDAVGCLVPYLILPYPIFCLYPLKPLFLTSVCDCCQLWELGIESAFVFMLSGFWDRILLAVGGLLFPCYVVL